MRAIVLSGGGSLGSYQIGVWKALRRLHIKYDIVTGTSVGALNGALMVQKNYYKAIMIWKKINMKVLFGEESASKNNKEILKMFSHEFLQNGGIEVKRVEETINKYINIKKFFKSKIDYGLVTVNLNKKKAVFLTKKQIKPEKLTDYLMASASCYPAFQMKKIEDEKYIDGGVIDNMPMNLAVKLGADEIIAVDLNSPGLRPRLKKKVPKTIIKPNNKLSFFLNFNEKGAKRNMIFGYNDTMKKFKKLDGKHFTFKKNHIKKCHRRYQQLYKYEIEKILNNEKLVNQIASLPLIKKAKKEQYTLAMMENLGKIFQLEETNIYSYKKFNKILLRKVKAELKATNLNKFSVNKILKSKVAILDIYQKLKQGKIKAIRKSAIMTPNEFLNALYLLVISEE